MAEHPGHSGTRDAEPMSGNWNENPPWVVPVPTDEDREFFEGASRGELRIQRCDECGLHQHYPRYLCSHCGSTEVKWVTASGVGTVYSFTVIRQNGVPPFRERLPFVVAAVDLEETGARLVASMPGADPAQVAIGMQVRATFRSVGEGIGLVDFA